MPKEPKKISPNKRDSLLSSLPVIAYSVFLLLYPTLYCFIRPAVQAGFKMVMPIMPVTFLAGICVLAMLIFSKRKQLVPVQIKAALVVACCVLPVWHMCDFYMPRSVAAYSRNSWHYFAYGVYTYLLYRYFTAKKVPLFLTISKTYSISLGIAIIDELLQKFNVFKSRVFDMNDIAKAGWGVLVAFIIILFIVEKAERIKTHGYKRQYAHFRGYTKHPFSLLVLLFVFNFLFLLFSSLLSSLRYFYFVILFTLIGFGMLFMLMHLLQYKKAKHIMQIIVLILIVSQAFSFICFHNEQIMFNSWGLTVYKGIPIAMFDILIYPSGAFRLVDKKRYFNESDRKFLFSVDCDTIIIGSGNTGFGGRGFKEIIEKQKNGAAVLPEVIIKRTPQACELYNKLKKQGKKKVLFVIRNSC